MQAMMQQRASPLPTVAVTHGYQRSEPGTRKLRVVVVRGEQLAKKDIFGASDPYVRIRLLRGRTHSLGQIGAVRTPTVKKTLNPVWNTSFFFRVKPENGLKFEVFDENRLTRDDFLGQAEIALNDHRIPTEDNILGVHELKFELRQRSRKSRVRGSLIVKLFYVNQEGLVSTMAWPTSPEGNSDQNTANGSGHTDDWEVINMEETEPLPEGWEERFDVNGRVYYVEHRTRRTQLERPSRMERPASIRELQREMVASLEHNYRRHISMDSDREPDEELPETVISEDFAVLTVEEAQPRSLSSSMSTLDHAVSKRQPLPLGWEERTSERGKKFFIDHTRKVTTWDDPRVKPPSGVRLEWPERKSSSRSPSGAPTGKKPKGHNPYDPSLPPLLAGWEIRFHEQSERYFFIDHNTHSTQWEDPRLEIKASPAKALEYSRDYKRKYDYLRAQLRKPHGTPNKFDIPVKRTRIFEDSFNVIMSVAPHRMKLLKARLWVEFDGEKGLDYGGVSREWFFLLSKAMFNPYYGLFEYSASDNYTLQINPNSGLCNEDHLKYFKFIGRVCGMAVFHGKLIDAFFVRPFYKMMLKKKITLADMEAVDTEYYNSLRWILENDPQCLDLTFQVESELFGQMQNMDLKPGGAQIPVTEANKKEYVNLVIQWRFCQRVERQMKAFLDGFHELIPFQLLKMFDEREIEYLLCGLGEIDLKDWRKHTVYKGGYSDQHPIIIWLWKAIESFDTELQHRLLQFITGTSRVPMNGFAELYGSNGPQRFCVERTGTVSALPRAHTCFNRLDLPPYQSYHVMREKLRLAVENCEGFEGVD